MIKFNKHILNNGLRLIHYQDSATRMVALNLLYNVGAKHESPEHTGLAHLMEHLMFSGSANVPSFDDALQAAGGNSNAWTSCDMTNYYESLPAHNIETALWAESDRLMQLSLTDECIRVQKDVVMEEFKQRNLNVPYGDMSHLMHSLVFKKHPYRWPTIGLELSHIENVTAEQINEFYRTHYSVNNLILGISGDVTFERAIELAEKWFGDIEPSGKSRPVIAPEPGQTEERRLTVHRDVPQDTIVMLYRMPGRADKGYPACDLLSDILANGKSARFYQNVLSRTTLFTELDAAVEGTIEEGLFMVRGRLSDGVGFEQAEAAIEEQLAMLCNDGVDDRELEKCVNKFHASLVFDNIGYQEKIQKLCEYELMGDAGLINNEVDRYRAVTCDDIRDVACRLFAPCNRSVLHYVANEVPTGDRAD